MGESQTGNEKDTNEYPNTSAYPHIGSPTSILCPANMVRKTVKYGLEMNPAA
jgi:hypothetical protein